MKNWDLIDKQQELFPRLVIGVGFTSKEYQARYGVSKNVAHAQLCRLMTAGKIEHIGTRPGTGHEKVYNVVSLASGKRLRTKNGS